VFDNIKKALLFALPTNGGDAGVILLAVFVGLALPVTAAQILWVNTVTAVTLAFEPAEPGVMRRPPRPPDEPLLTRPLLVRVLFFSLLTMATTFAAFEWELARGRSLGSARTAPAWRLETLLGNRVVLGVALAVVPIQFAFTCAAPMQRFFRTELLGGVTWLVIAALGVALFVAVEADERVLRRLRVRRL
jgi:magnesium-transporting ATPase (P-type)